MRGRSAAVPATTSTPRTRVAAGLLAAAVAALSLGGCGGSGAPIAGCLDAKGFLVRQRGQVVDGSSAGGVNFTLTLYPDPSAARGAFSRLDRTTSALVGDGVIDFAGNPPAHPGRAPGRLSRAALAAVGTRVAHP
jgi:hypothetical protein